MISPEWRHHPAPIATLGWNFRRCSLYCSLPIPSSTQTDLTQDESDSAIREALRLNNMKWAAGLAPIADCPETVRGAVNTLDSEITCCFSTAQEEPGFLQMEMEAISTLLSPPPDLSVALTELAKCAVMLDDLRAKMSPSERK